MSVFEAQLSNTLTLTKIINALRNIVNQSTLECTGEGIQLQSMDDSHVSLVCLSLRREYFEKYKCTRNVSLGLDFKSLTKVLKCASGDDAVTIRHIAESDKIQFSFESAGKERTADYELRLLNLDQEHLAVPETEYSCVVHMPSTEFARICRDLCIFSEAVVIACSKDGIKFSANGDLGSANIKLSETAKAEVTLKVDEPVSLSFAGRYLITFTHASPLSEKVKIAMAANVPLLVEYPIEDDGYIRYYLAPKVEDPDG